MLPQFLIDLDEKNGVPTLVVQMDGNRYQTGSKKDVILESRRIVATLPAEKKIFILGIGNFALIRELQVQGIINRCVLCACKKIEGDLVLKTLVQICSTGICSKIFWFDETFPLDNPPYDPLHDSAIHIFNTPSAMLYRKFGLVDLQKMVEGHISGIQNDFLTQAVFGKVWHRNILQNTQYLLTKLPVFRIPSLKGRSFLVVGAGPGTEILGPSMKRWLAENPDTKVLCADTIFRRMGLILDSDRLMSMTVDPQVHSCFHFLGINTSPLHFRELGSHTSLFRTGTSIPLPGPHYLSRYLFEGSDYPLLLQSPGRNVGHSMVSFLKSQGAGSIHTIGMDFCSIHGQNYSRYTASHLDALTLQSRLAPLESLFTDSSLHAGEDGTFRNPLLKSYAEDFTDAFGMDGNLHRISWNSDAFPYAHNDKTWQEKSIQIQMADYKPGMEKKMVRFFQFCHDWKESANPFDLASLKKQWNTGFWILYPLIVHHYRNNLKNGIKDSDSRDKASQDSLNHALSMAGFWLQRG